MTEKKLNPFFNANSKCIVYSARSHVGRVRENNEDNLFVDGVYLSSEMRERPFSIDGVAGMPAIFAVCDGMGGEDHGEAASLYAVQKLSEHSESIKMTAKDRREEMVQMYVLSVNAAIQESVGDSGERMGTTLAMSIIEKDATVYYNIGDSRIYCLGTSEFGQVNNDHTLRAEKELLGQSEQIRENDAHKLTRCIGIGNMPIAEGYPPISGACRLLMCSDGLTDLVEDKEIERVMRNSAMVADAANSLLNLALVYGGYDNISIIVLDIPKGKFHPFAGMLKKIASRRIS